jgi:hypothetical protein
VRRIAQAAITALVATLVLTFVAGEQETKSQSPQEIMQRSSEALSGKENNWVQTWSGKGWFVILRLYGPLEPFFDKTWRPS